MADSKLLSNPTEDNLAEDPRRSQEIPAPDAKAPPGGGWITPPPVGWTSTSSASKTVPGVSAEIAESPAVRLGSAIPRTFVAGPKAPVETLKKPRRSLFSRIFRDVVIPLVVAFAIAMFAQATLAKPYQIPTGSMLPTIQLDDRILANRVVYYFFPIGRGDVVVFNPPNMIQSGGTPYVKRVVGLPGDTVEIRKGQVLVNGEEFVVDTASVPAYTKPKETVPEGMLFVLGDNRNESSDSHIWGYVPMENIIGKAELIYWPPQHLTWLGG